MLKAYVAAAKTLELDPFHMLRRAGLPIAALDQPDYPISVDKVQALLADSARSANTEELGLLVGLYFKLSMQGPLALLMREQDTVGEALKVLQRYLRYQSDSIDIQAEPREGGLAVSLEGVYPRSRASRLFTDLCVAMYVQVFRGLLGDGWSPKCVAFGYPKPADAAPYQALSSDVQFGRHQNGFFLTDSDLATRLPEADPLMAREIARYIEARTPERASLTTAEAVSALIQRLLPEGNCSVDRVAQHLGVDRRTVHRRLAAEGRSFSALLESTRREAATRRLIQSSEPLAQVAASVGFSSLSTFSRWFRQAHGVQPSEYRRMSHHP